MQSHQVQRPALEAGCALCPLYAGINLARGACRLKWQSGQPFAGMFDAAPTTTNATQFLRIDGNQLVIDCKRCACMPHEDIFAATQGQCPGQTDQGCTLCLRLSCWDVIFHMVHWQLGACISA